MSLVKNGISFVKKDLLPNTKKPLAPSVDIRFAHMASEGDKSIDLLNLVTPEILSSNGFVQATNEQILGAKLSVFHKNLTLSSTARTLIPYKDWKIVGNYIQFEGALKEFGALEGEIFFGTVRTAPAANSVFVDSRDFKVTVEGLAGEQVLNIGMPFKVNENPSNQVGAIKVYSDGVLLLRNVNNATADDFADGNYEELDSGNGYGTQIKLNQPLSEDTAFVIEGGKMLGSADVQVWGGIEKLTGAIIKLAQEQAYNFYGSDDISNILDASPQEIERRGFGDLLKSIETKLSQVILDNRIQRFLGYKLSNQSIAANTQETIVDMGATVDNYNAFNGNDGLKIAFDGYLHVNMYTLMLGAWAYNEAKHTYLAIYRGGTLYNRIQIMYDRHYGATSATNYYFPMKADMGNLAVNKDDVIKLEVYLGQAKTLYAGSSSYNRFALTVTPNKVIEGY